jgi:hypothetical protein
MIVDVMSNRPAPDRVNSSGKLAQLSYTPKLQIKGPARIAQTQIGPSFSRRRELLLSFFGPLVRISKVLLQLLDILDS